MVSSEVERLDGYLVHHMALLLAELANARVDVGSLRDPLLDFGQTLRADCPTHARMRDPWGTNCSSSAAGRAFTRRKGWAALCSRTGSTFWCRRGGSGCSPSCYGTG